MKRVAVLGGGPAGAMAAAKLASAGLETVLLDEKLAWEKPCGGGLTYKAYSRYPFLIENSIPKRLVHNTILTDLKGGEVTMRLCRPLVIYSRLDLNQMLLVRAEEAGAQIAKDRVLAMERRSSVWRVRTKAGSFEADYIVVATGARNPLRTVGTEWTASDTMCALGYFVPAFQEHVDIQFFPGFEGYIWVFPRCGHLSVGICGKGEPSSLMRLRLEHYMRGRGLYKDGSRFYGHMIPALNRPSWRRNRIAGEGWMAVGDAAGLVDPVTGEGLYYAVRSGDLAAESILTDSVDPALRHQVYRTSLQNEFTSDLALGAAVAKRFFLERFLFSSVPARMIGLMRRSPRMMEIVQDLFSGTQDYSSLKRRLIENLNGTLVELAMGIMLSHRIVKEGR